KPGCPEACRRVPQIAARHDKARLPARLPLVLNRGGGIVDHLGEESSQAYAVCRGESARSGKVLVLEGLLHQALAGVEVTPDAQGCHVPAPTGELLLLPRRYHALRVEDHDLEARAPGEGRRYRPSRIPGGGNEHGE